MTGDEPVDANDRPLAGKTALVTGGAIRIGAAIAERLALAGADLVVHHGASHAAASEMVARIEKLGRRAWPLHADLASPQSAAQLVPEARRLAGGLDVLVNSAAIFPEGDATSIDDGTLARVMQINAWSPVTLARAFAADAPDGANVVNLLDTRIHRVERDHFAYNTSKSTLAALTRGLALAFAPRVRVNGVAPGAILPPPDAPPEHLARVVHARVPLARAGTPRDVADAVLYLATSPFVTGIVLTVDGGEHLNGRIPSG